MSAYRTLLTFSVCSYVALSALEDEFRHHVDLNVGTGFDGRMFILVVECPDAAMAEWEVRGTVLTFDPDSVLCRRTVTWVSGSTVETEAVEISAELA